MTRAKILIVDDEANIRLMMRTALRTDGYEVIEAADGRAALAAIEQQSPDLVVLDLSMPVLDGMGVLKELRMLNLERTPRVVVLTAFGSIPVAVKATRLGAVDFLEKPISLEELRTAVEAAMAEPEVHAEHNAAEIATAGGYSSVLERVCDALRMARFTDAETLLMKAADLAQKDPFYFNLLGVLYETQQEWKLARKMYGKAIKLDGSYVPAQQNMQRIYELETFGRSGKMVMLGDETEVRLADLVRHKK